MFIEAFLNKKYKIGYTSGVFDLFHIGHLNILKRSKELCDYLIVGVNTDELVETYKKKRTVISFEERIAIVESIKYVDQVIAQKNLDKMEVWNNHKFDAVFIGSDWKGSQRWKDTEEILKTVGADVVYLPYTINTSSSILKETLDKINRAE